MYGALLGDMIGAPYEFDRGDKTKVFPLFSKESHFTDDSVMTIAVADALLGLFENADEENIHHEVARSMRIWGRKYPRAGYGGRFRDWLFTHWQPKPYGSYGNGSAMRVSSVGWLYDTLEETRRYAKMTAEVTHNHPEGIKGAEATASAIFLARTGTSKDEIREYIVREFDYDLSRTCDEIRPGYHHVESCQETVPEAIIAFLEGNDFEDVIRMAVSLGGDCDTLTCIAGSIAEACYGIPEELKEECRKRLPADMLEVLDRFEARRGAGKERKMAQTIEIRKIGITKLDTDAVVNAANTGLWEGSGVCGYIFRDAGSAEMTAACKKIGHCDEGSAVITPGFKLPAKFVIHAVGPRWTDGNHNEPKLLYSAYKQSLRLAMENGLHSIGFPLISAGIFGYPVDKAWRKAIQACRDFVQESPEYDIDIVFAVLDDKIKAVGEKTIEEIWN